MCDTYMYIWPLRTLTSLRFLVCVQIVYVQRNVSLWDYYINNLAFFPLHRVDDIQDIKILTQGYYGNMHECMTKYNDQLIRHECVDVCVKIHTFMETSQYLLTHNDIILGQLLTSDTFLSYLCNLLTIDVRNNSHFF